MLRNSKIFTKIKRPGSLPTPIAAAARSPHKVRFCAGDHLRAAPGGIWPFVGDWEAVRDQLGRA